MTQLILGTTSKPRQQLFSQLGVDFISKGSDVDEYFEGRPDTPKELCLELARLKAENVSQHFSKGLVLGLDTVAFFEGEIIEKPKSRDELYLRLQRFSGNTLTVYTGIHIIDIQTKKAMSKVVSTEVEFRDLTDVEIHFYLDSFSEYSKYTLGFNPTKSIAATFTKRISGSLQNYIAGIPIEAIIEMLSAFDFTL